MARRFIAKVAALAQLLCGTPEGLIESLPPPNFVPLQFQEWEEISPEEIAAAKAEIEEQKQQPSQEQDNEWVII